MAKIYYKNLHMSDFCSKFAAEFDMIMEKRTYIQPKMEVAVLPQDALMDLQPLAGSPTMGTVGTNTGGGAPKRHDTGPSGVWL